MSELLKRCILMLVRPPLLLIRALASVVYPAVFGRSDKRIAETRELQLAVTVKEVFAFLFIESDAKIVGRDPVLQFPPPFDYASICVVRRNLMFRFVRGREEEHVSLRRSDIGERWHELSLVLDLVDAPENVKRGSLQDFYTASRLLQSNLKVIEEAFSEVHYPEFRKKIDEIYARDRVILKQHETELNRRLYG
jgi:hypothetical protein